MAALPILSRIYSPAEFGSFALLTAPTLLLAPVMSLCYEKSILLPDENSDADTIAQLCTVLIGLVSIASGTVIAALFLLGSNLALIYNVGSAMFLIPVAAAGTALFAVQSNRAIRAGQYRLLAFSTLVRAMSLVGTQLILGLTNMGWLGLASGFVIGQWAGTSILSMRIRNSRPRAKLGSYRRLFARYKSFPIFSVPSTLANASTTHLIALLVGGTYGPNTLGQYSMTQRVLALPSTVLATAISNVYLRQVTRNRRSSTKSGAIFDRITVRIASLSAIIFGVLLFFGSELFSLILGEDWSVAGGFASVLAPMFFFRFVQSCIATTTTAYERQRFALGSQLSYLGIALTAFAITQLADQSIIAFLTLFSAGGSAHSIVVIYLMRRMVRKDDCEIEEGRI
ncbi:oligosaccharide flippase family protein [Dietzia cinnamea]|nr:oligosaccharide flippase family protein [Dietzia cinnamea]